MLLFITTLVFPLGVGMGREAGNQEMDSGQRQGAGGSDRNIFPLSPEAQQGCGLRQGASRLGREDIPAGPCVSEAFAS